MEEKYFSKKREIHRPHLNKNKPGTGEMEEGGGRLLAHLVRVALSALGQFALELNLNLKVQVTIVALIRLHAERPEDLLARLHRQVLVQVKHSLFPVCIARLGSCQNKLSGNLVLKSKYFSSFVRRNLSTGISWFTIVPILNILKQL